MKWYYWALLILALALIVSPVLFLVAAALRTAFQIIGTLLLIVVIIWAIVAISRATRRSTTGQAM